MGTLHVVATPLGNLGDLTERAREVLRSVGLVAAEDTRRTRILLEKIEARPRLISYHAHSDTSRLAEIIDALTAGTDVALVSDAGTPTVSDPGVSLVSAARSVGIPVTSVPGPSAVVAALSVSGLSGDRFTFLGFLPRKGRDRSELLDFIVRCPWTVVLYEAANRLERTLAELAQWAGGGREAVVARELTKIHEEVRPGTLESLAVYYGNHPPRGEVTVLIRAADPAPVERDPEEIRERGRQFLAAGMSGKDAAAELARDLGISRNHAYKVINSL